MKLAIIVCEYSDRVIHALSLRFLFNFDVGLLRNFSGAASVRSRITGRFR